MLAFASLSLLVCCFSSPTSASDYQARLIATGLLLSTVPQLPVYLTRLDLASSKSTMSLPIIDLDMFRADPESAEAHAEAGKVSEVPASHHEAAMARVESSGTARP